MRATTTTGERISPPFRLHLLGRILTGLRDQSGLTGQQVAEATGVTPSTLSRLERGRNQYATAGDVRRLLDLYEAEQDVRAQCLRLVTTARVTPYWAEHKQGLGDLVEYVSYETEAELIRYWQPTLIPGHLQTEAYAHAVLKAGQLDDDPAMLRLRVRARMARQWITHCERPVHVQAVMTEASLRQRVGGTQVMREQLARLIAEARMPHVDLRVLPDSVGAHPGMSGGFVLLKLPTLGEVLFVEAGYGGIMDHGPRAAEFSRTFVKLLGAALPARESVDIIGRVWEGMG